MLRQTRRVLSDIKRNSYAHSFDATVLCGELNTKQEHAHVIKIKVCEYAIFIISHHEGTQTKCLPCSVRLWWMRMDEGREGGHEVRAA